MSLNSIWKRRMRALPVRPLPHASITFSDDDFLGQSLCSLNEGYGPFVIDIDRCKRVLVVEIMCKRCLEHVFAFAKIQKFAPKFIKGVTMDVTMFINR